ncbi:hypothetical protein K0M31_007215 [Melipona bicolor]|uniref:Uncharacterized protein n=1 Tax=Melipona bicolor TaxID=60889 RepID=A0AA40GB74_9HYME|nr:hypothetical protein K0M31_007215 [Melipona bicolor]
MLRDKYLCECNSLQQNDEKKLSTGGKKEELFSPKYPNDEWCVHAASKFTATGRRQARADIPDISKRSETVEAKLGERLAERRKEGTEKENGSLTRDKLVKGGALGR